VVEGEGEGVRVGEVMVFTGAGMKKKGESVDGREGKEAKKHSMLEETKGTKVVGDSVGTEGGGCNGD
ncbi:hypothetical protein A2U01_0075188, partial [Trifolium medium]|nr:hypothetical protein [Trifolium medium]